ncbi:MAG: hypothetical protein M3R49_05015 [Chloroflexota bacterium]|nr:hypothetical protein [Chloroflexota bacterium]
MRRLRPWIGPLGWAVSLYGFATFAWILWSQVQLNGGEAYDAHAYLLAARHLLAGEPLYTSGGIGDPGAYRYPPTFALLLAPTALVPQLAAVWLYRLACLVCLRYLVGSWRAVGWSLLLPPVWIELVALNLTLPIAAAGRWALRDDPGAAWLPAGAALKYGSALLAPFLWAVRPSSRRPLLIGSGIVIGLMLAHAALDPGVWQAYFASLRQQASSNDAGTGVNWQLLHLVPSTTGDFALRSGLAAVMVVIAIRRRCGWLAYLAATIAVPTLWLARLAPLVAVPRLWWEERRDAAALAADHAGAERMGPAPATT